MSQGDLSRRAVLSQPRRPRPLVRSPARALAHGIAGKTDLPLPRWLFAWSAAVVLIVSFVGARDAVAGRCAWRTHAAGS